MGLLVGYTLIVAAMRTRLAFVAAGATSAVGVPSLVFSESDRRSGSANASGGNTSGKSEHDVHGGGVVFAPATPPRAYPHARLEFVQLLSRHGDRTSINPLPFETKLQWKPFLLDDVADRRLAKFAEPSPPNPTLLDNKRTDAHGADVSWHGQLTSQGETQLKGTGASLRRWLVGNGENNINGHVLLPFSLRQAVATGAVKIRSTSTRRTVQSSQALVSGLYPEDEQEEDDGDKYSSNNKNPSLPIEVRDRFRESMFPNPGMACVRQTELMRALDGDKLVIDAEERAWQSEYLASVRQEVHLRNLERRKRHEKTKMKQSIESSGGEATVADDTSTSNDSNALPSNLRQPSATSVWEPLQARANHGLPLPTGVTVSDVSLIRNAAEVRYVNRSRNAEGAGLAGGRLLKELSLEIAANIADSAKQDVKRHRLSIYSGHDSSILALLAVLHAFPGEWPPVASTVVVETWSVRELIAGDRSRGSGRRHWSDTTLGEALHKTASDTTGPQIMVRVLFNGRVLALDGCPSQDLLSNGGLCSLHEFIEMARERDPIDFKLACQSKL